MKSKIENYELERERERGKDRQTERERETNRWADKLNEKATILIQRLLDVQVMMCVCVCVCAR